MSSYLIYRKPNTEECFITNFEEIDIKTIYDYKDIFSQKGFIFAPFQVSKETPIYILPTQHKTSFNINEIDLSDKTDAFDEVEIVDIEGSRNKYNEEFNTFHSEIVSGGFSKIVLSRQRIVTLQKNVPCVAMFYKACLKYKNAFIALVSLSNDEKWLVVTPEILLKQMKNHFSTIALAGTMSVNDDIWSDKNKVEQAFVAQYIRETITSFTNEIEESEPQTIVAGNLKHIKTSFNFTLNDMEQAGLLVEKLHPTPAVCGIPKQETKEFILKNEKEKRLYYSGFCGEISPLKYAHLYVTLRCAKIHNNICTLFAGGGLVAESQQDMEWRETEAKMQTIMSLFNLK